MTFGELAAWLIGWNLTLGYGISSGTFVLTLLSLEPHFCGIAGIARSWASYVTMFLQVRNDDLAGVPHDLL